MIDQIANGRVRMDKQSEKVGLYRCQLKEQLSREGRKLLLRIIDEKDLCIERASYRNYRQGFRDGLELALELFGTGQ